MVQEQVGMVQEQVGTVRDRVGHDALKAETGGNINNDDEKRPFCEG